MTIESTRPTDDRRQTRTAELMRGEDIGSCADALTRSDLLLVQVWARFYLAAPARVAVRSGIVPSFASSFLEPKLRRPRLDGSRIALALASIVAADPRFPDQIVRLRVSISELRPLELDALEDLIRDVGPHLREIVAAERLWRLGALDRPWDLAIEMVPGSRPVLRVIACVRHPDGPAS